MGCTQVAYGENSVDRIISNPPFGKLEPSRDTLSPVRKMLKAYDRVLRNNGRAVLLVAEFGPLRAAARNVGWKLIEQHHVRVLGQKASLTVWRKSEPDAPARDSMPSLAGASGSDNVDLT